jgi:hypothetical protein
VHLRPNPDGTFLLGADDQPNSWSETLTPDQLPARLALYRRLRDRGGKAGQPGPWAKHYTATVTNLARAIAALPATRKDA